MDEVFAAYMQGILPFPAPTKTKRGERLVSPPAEPVAKTAQYVAWLEAYISNVQLARKLGVDEKEIFRWYFPL